MRDPQGVPGVEPGEQQRRDVALEAQQLGQLGQEFQRRPRHERQKEQIAISHVEQVRNGLHNEAGDQEASHPRVRPVRPRAQVERHCGTDP
jgi:hypothetical protein